MSFPEDTVDYIYYLFSKSSRARARARWGIVVVVNEIVTRSRGGNRG